MLKIYCGGDCIHDPTSVSYRDRDDVTDLLVWNISITKKINDPDILSFVIHDKHPFSQKVYPDCEEIRVDRYETTPEIRVTPIFYGKVLSTSINIQGERTINCEGELGYLLDSIIPAFAKTKVYNSKMVEYILSAHNAQMTGRSVNKKIYLGTGTYDFPYLRRYDANDDGFIFAADSRLIQRNATSISNNFYSKESNQEDAATERRNRLSRDILWYSMRGELPDDSPLRMSKFTWSTDGTERALDIIHKHLTDPYGGVLSIRHDDNGLRRLDYKNINKGDSPKEHSHIATLDNILDISYDKSAEEKFTIVYPIGAEITETDSLEVRALEGKTWLAFGDGNTVCRPDTGVTVDMADVYEATFFDDIANGKVAKFEEPSGNDSYTGYLDTAGTRHQINRFTTHYGSYVNLLTKAAKMKTITMAEETETIFKHGGHRVKIDGSVKHIQDWNRDGTISTHQDKSVVERLYDIFGPAVIAHTSESLKIKNTEDQINKVVTDVAVKMVLQHDIDNHVDTDYWTQPLDGLRSCDFVTVAVGLNDWLNADSILGTNEMGRKFSSYLDAAGTTAANLHKATSSNAIDDYMEKTYEQDATSGATILDPKHNSYFDEDGKRITFKQTLYWQIRYLCMYLKACFPLSHIIIFSSFGSKSKEDKGGTDEKNEVGRKGWYSDVSGHRVRRTFYSKIEQDPYMKPNESDKDNNGDWKAAETTPPDDNPGGRPYDFVKVGSTWYRKTHINGTHTKTTKTSYKITTEGRNPNQDSSIDFDEDDYLAFAKVSRQEVDPTADTGGSGGTSSGGSENVPQPGDDDNDGTVGETELAGGDGDTTTGGDSEPAKKSVAYLAYIYEWNSEDKTASGHYAYTPSGAEGTWGDFENAPEVICNPYEVLDENSYSISELNSAIQEVCEELGIVYVDSEDAAGISVNNYSDIKDISNADPQTDPDVVKIGHTSTMPYNNVSLLTTDDTTGEITDVNGTKAGTWGESFINGSYLNDRGQLAMAKAVRNAMIECLVSDGTIESVEHLTIKGTEHPYYAPILYDATKYDPDEKEYGDLDINVWRAMRIIPVQSGKLVKIDGVYDTNGQHITRTKSEDKGGFGKYDLIDYFGNYNPQAFEAYDISPTGENPNITLNTEATEKMVPIAPADPMVAIAQFDDITDQQELFYAAAEYLYNNYGQNTVNITAKIIDMHIIDIVNGVPMEDVSNSIEIGDVVLVTAKNYGLDESPCVVDTIVEGEDPTNTTITLKSVGAGNFAGEQLAANPYGSYGKRTGLNLLYAPLSEILGVG